MLCILWNTKFLLLRLIVLFRENCLEEFIGFLQFNTYIIMWQRNVRHAELQAIPNIQILSCLSYKQMQNSTYSSVYQMPLQYQHVLLGYCTALIHGQSLS